MGALNEWQRLSRIGLGNYGDGREGPCTTTTIPSLALVGGSGTNNSGQNVLNTGSASFSNGDIIFIHQTRGTGAGQWEINKITSGGGSTALTLEQNLHYTYIDSGASQFQIIKVMMYSSINVSSGTWTIDNWDGNGFGILPIACNGDATFANTINGTALGFRGGSSYSTDGAKGHQGEGSGGDRDTHSFTNNGNGGGGSDLCSGGSRYGGGGGGGGNGAAGSVGVASWGSGSGTGTPAYGGVITNPLDGTVLLLGGGGGSGGSNGSATGAGGAGGTIIVFFIKNLITTSATITDGGGNGANGDSGYTGGGGGGAGGTILIVCQTATLGTARITAPKGNKGTNVDGGNGADGLIIVQHSGPVSGTTTPAFQDLQDSTLTDFVPRTLIFN
jgi:hypothetical protein